MLRRFAISLSYLFFAFFVQQAIAQDNDSSSNPDSTAAQLQVRISQLEEQMRNLQGEIERVSFQNQQLKTQLDKSNGDIQYRLNALESKQNTPPVTAAAPMTAAHEDTTQLRPSKLPKNEDESDEGKEFSAAEQPEFTTPRDHYDYAFGLLNHAQYAKAGEAFAAFTKQYPKDPLIGNAYYWLGETYYVRRDYVQAADKFRQGYEAMPSGPKAGDNLLKLSMALGALNKNKEACVVLKQVVVKYGSTSSSTKSHAEQEMNRIGCD